ncbi:MAG: hypothetical protein ABIA76_04030 [Candidatus Diapherotrites archaeon]
MVSIDRRVLLLVLAAFIIAGAVFVAFSAQESTKTYSFSFDKADLIKTVFDSEETYSEKIEVRNARNYALVALIPKKLAENVNDFKKLKYDSKFRVLDADPILEFYSNSQNSFSIELGFEKKQNLCSVNFLFPRTYFDSMNEQEMEELKEELKKHADFNLSCEKANELEKEIAGEFEAIFYGRNAEAREENEEGKAELNEKKEIKEKQELEAKLNEAQKNNEKLNKEKNGIIYFAEEENKHNDVMNVLKRVREAIENANISVNEEGYYVITLFGEEGEESPADLTEEYGFLSRKEPINLTVSDEVPESIYSNHLVHPVFDEERDNVKAGKPRISFEGIKSEQFEVNVSNEEEPYLFELKFIGDKYAIQQASVSNKISGNVVIDYSNSIFLYPKIIIPINVWFNPCKTSAEESQSNAETINALIECYDLSIEEAKGNYAENYVEAKENERDELDEFIEEKNIRFVSAEYTHEILDRFEGFDFGLVEEGLFKNNESIVVQDEIDLLELNYPEIVEITAKMEIAKEPTIILNAFQKKLNLLEFLISGENIFLEEEKPEFIQEIEKEKKITLKGKEKFLAEKEFALNDPFKEENLENYLSKIIELERTVIESNDELSEEQKTSELNGLNAKINELRIVLIEQYGSSEEIINSLETEALNLETQIAYYEGLDPKWYSWTNPLIYIGVIFETPGGVWDWIKEGGTVWKSLKERAEGKLKIEEKIKSVEMQKQELTEIISELKKGKSLFDLYPKNARSYVPMTSLESRTEKSMFAHSFTYNATLRNEYRKRKFLANEYFLESIIQAEDFFNILHALELERDSLLSLEIFLVHESLKAGEIRDWRERSPVGAIQWVLEKTQQNEAERSALAQNFRRERLGIEKILTQLKQGIPLLEISEANKKQGFDFVLGEAVPTIINSDITLELIGFASGEAEIKAYLNGIDKGNAKIKIGEINGFHNVPGLIVRPESHLADGLHAKIIYSPEWNKEKNISQSLFLSKEAVFPTSQKEVLAAFTGAKISSDSGILYCEIPEDTDSSDVKLFELNTELLLFQGISEAKAKELLQGSLLGKGTLSDIKEYAENNMEKADLIEIKTHYCFEVNDLGAPLKEIPLKKVSSLPGVKVNAIGEYFITSEQKEFASEEFPEVAFKIEYKQGRFPAEISYTEIVQNSSAETLAASKPDSFQGEQDADSLISTALNNPTVDSLVQQRILAMQGKLTEEKQAEMIYKIAQRYESNGLLQEALTKFNLIENIYPNTSYTEQAKIKSFKATQAMGAQQFVHLMDTLTNVENVAWFVVPWAAIKGVKIYAKASNLAEITQTTKISLLDDLKAPVVAAGREEFTLASSSIDDFFTSILYKGIMRYKNWKAVRYAKKIAPELSRAGEAAKALSTEKIYDLDALGGTLKLELCSCAATVQARETTVISIEPLPGDELQKVAHTERLTNISVDPFKKGDELESILLALPEQKTNLHSISQFNLDEDLKLHNFISEARKRLKAEYGIDADTLGDQEVIGALLGREYRAIRYTSTPGKGVYDICKKDIEECKKLYNFIHEKTFNGKVKNQDGPYNYIHREPMRYRNAGKPKIDFRYTGNVEVNEKLIITLDEFIQRADLPIGKYKVASPLISEKGASAANSKQDTVLLYFTERLNPSQETELINLLKPHIRTEFETIIGERLAKGIEFQTNVSAEEYAKIIKAAEEFSPSLANMLKGEIKIPSQAISARKVVEYAKQTEENQVFEAVLGSWYEHSTGGSTLFEDSFIVLENFDPSKVTEVVVSKATNLPKNKSIRIRFDNKTGQLSIESNEPRSILLNKGKFDFHSGAALKDALNALSAAPKEGFKILEKIILDTQSGGSPVIIASNEGKTFLISMGSNGRFYLSPGMSKSAIFSGSRTSRNLRLDKFFSYLAEEGVVPKQALTHTGPRTRELVEEFRNLGFDDLRSSETTELLQTKYPELFMHNDTFEARTKYLTAREDNMWSIEKALREAFSEEPN